MKLMSSTEIFKARGYIVRIEYEYYLCEDSGEEFETPEQLESNLDKINREIEKQCTSQSNP